MASNNTVFYIEPRNRAVHYFYMPNGEKSRILHDVANYSGRHFEREFFERFITILQDFAKKYPAAQAQNTTIVLPDNAVFTDTFSLPNVRGNGMKNNVNSTLDGIYKNRKELKLNTFQALQNRQFVTFCTTGVQNELLFQLKTACSTSKLVAQNITFAANATVNAVSVLNPKLKTSTYMLLDMKEFFTRVVYVFKGVAVGYASLPFGSEILASERLAAEDLLFDHSVAELAVLNARERAKAKSLTMMGEDNPDVIAAAEGEGEEKTGEESSFANVDSLTVNRTAPQIKTLPKKTARKLPKFMLRPAPETSEQRVYENFRIFEKWALCYIAGNDRLTALGDLEAVYVNMPEEFDFLYDMVNAEEEENGVKFLSLGIRKEMDVIHQNLEMYGGFFASRMNTTNNF